MDSRFSPGITRFTMKRQHEVIPALRRRSPNETFPIAKPTSNIITTCSHCRKTKQMLEEVKREMSRLCDSITNIAEEAFSIKRSLSGLTVNNYNEEENIASVSTLSNVSQSSQNLRYNPLNIIFNKTDQMFDTPTRSDIGYSSSSGGDNAINSPCGDENVTMSSSIHMIRVDNVESDVRERHPRRSSLTVDLPPPLYRQTNQNISNRKRFSSEPTNEPYLSPDSKLQRLDSSSSTSPLNIDKKNSKDPTSNDLQIDDMLLHKCLVESIPVLAVPAVWEHGVGFLPPVQHWNDKQMEMFEERLSKWKLILQCFNDDLNGSAQKLMGKFLKSDGAMCTVNEAAALLEERLLTDSNTKTPSTNHSMLREQLYPRPEEKTYILPRRIDGKKVDAIDVICIWQHGYGDMPPVKDWSPAQKAKQQSKVSRWHKLYRIFKSECDGSMKEFTKKFSTQGGILMTISAILELYKQEDSIIISGEAKTSITESRVF